MLEPIDQQGLPGTSCALQPCSHELPYRAAQAPAADSGCLCRCASHSTALLHQQSVVPDASLPAQCSGFPAPTPQKTLRCPRSLDDTYRACLQRIEAISNLFLGRPSAKVNFNDRQHRGSKHLQPVRQRQALRPRMASTPTKKCCLVLRVAF